VGVSRRGFLASLFGGAAWQFMPTGPMCWPAASSRNTLITPEWVVKESAKYFAMSLKAAAHMNRRYDDDLAFTMGDTITFRRPESH
jgi:hypothetical protein